MVGVVMVVVFIAIISAKRYGTWGRVPAVDADAAFFAKAGKHLGIYSFAHCRSAMLGADVISLLPK